MTRPRVESNSWLVRQTGTIPAAYVMSAYDQREPAIIRHQNWVVWELFSRAGKCGKLDEEKES